MVFPSQQHLARLQPANSRTRPNMKKTLLQLKKNEAIPSDGLIY